MKKGLNQVYNLCPVQPKERFVNSRKFLLSMVFLLIQSCQYNNNATSKIGLRQHQNQRAAMYNTQLGLAYLAQGDRPRAKRKLLMALDEDPKSPHVNAAMAYFMEKTGAMSEARLYYRKAVRIAPRNGAQLNNYGAFLCRNGQYALAEAYFLKAVKDVEYEHTAGAYENAGLCAVAIPDYAKAKKYFTQALEQDPSRQESLYQLVNIEMKRHPIQRHHRSNK